MLDIIGGCLQPNNLTFAKFSTSHLHDSPTRQAKVVICNIVYVEGSQYCNVKNHASK